jgi:hypothetical protein
MLKVMTWLWAQPGGRATYTAHHVNIWAEMVDRHLRMPHTLACVTDMPEGLDGNIEVVTPPDDYRDTVIPTWQADKPQCFRRLSLFRPDAADIFGPRFVSMDMDCIIEGELDTLFNRPHDFMMYRGTHRSRPYNGSMVMMTAGARPQVFTEFTPHKAIMAGRRFLGSDQAWISQVLGFGEKTWSEADGVVGYRSAYRSPKPPLLTFFFGNPKPWDLVAEGNPWAVENYRLSGRGGRALYLGTGQNLWSDVDDAFHRGPVHGIIASPEAAKHWPRKPLAIVPTESQARRLAIMHGFDSLEVCGPDRFQLDQAAA